MLFMTNRTCLLNVLLFFLGSGSLWGQTQENYLTYEGLEYTFVEIQEGSNGYYYCAGLNLDSIKFKLFVLNENLEIEYTSQKEINGPIGLRRSGDSILMATYDNASFDFNIFSIEYQAGDLQKDTLLTQNIIIYDENDSTETTIFGFIKLKVVDDKFTGIMVSEGTTADRPPLNISHYFIENVDHTITLDRLERYFPLSPALDIVMNAFDFNDYQDSLYILRSFTTVSIYDKEWNLIDGRSKPNLLYNQGFILPYGDDFMSFGRVRANSGNLYETVPIISFLDNDFNVIRVDSFWSPNEDHFGAPSWLGGLVSSSESDIFFVSATQGNHWFFNWGIIDTTAQVYLRAYDDQMNNLWEVVIGDTLHHVSVLKMELLPNGNLMLLGSEASPASKYKFRPLIIEIDPDGTIVSTTNPVPIQSMDVSLYPNPVRDQIFLDWKGENLAVDVQIVNAAGQEVQQLQDVRRGSAIDVARLSSGMYYLILRKDGKMLNSKPFVKGGR